MPPLLSGAKSSDAAETTRPRQESFCVLCQTLLAIQRVPLCSVRFLSEPESCRSSDGQSVADVDLCGGSMLRVGLLAAWDGRRCACGFASGGDSTCLPNFLPKGEATDSAVPAWRTQPNVDLFDPEAVIGNARRSADCRAASKRFLIRNDSGKCLPSPFRFCTPRRIGNGIQRLLPAAVGDVRGRPSCMIRSLHTLVNDHEGALRHFQTGKPQIGRPTLGAWIAFALGTQNSNLPPYVVLSDPNHDQVDGIRNWSAGFLPAVFQGTPMRCDGPALFDLALPTGHDVSEASSKSSFPCWTLQIAARPATIWLTLANSKPGSPTMRLGRPHPRMRQHYDASISRTNASGAWAYAEALSVSRY